MQELRGITGYSFASSIFIIISAVPIHHLCMRTFCVDQDYTEHIRWKYSAILRSILEQPTCGQASCFGINWSGLLLNSDSHVRIFSCPNAQTGTCECVYWVGWMYVCRRGGGGVGGKGGRGVGEGGLCFCVLIFYVEQPGRHVHRLTCIHVHIYNSV